MPATYSVAPSSNLLMASMVILILFLGFGFASLVPASFHESLQEVLFPLLQFRRFANQPHRFLADKQGLVPKLLGLHCNSNMGHLKRRFHDFFCHLFVPLWKAGYGAQVGDDTSGKQSACFFF